MKFGSWNEAPIAWKGLPFRAHEPESDARAEPRVGTPSRFDHLYFLPIIRIAPDDGTTRAERRV